MGLAQVLREVAIADPDPDGLNCWLSADVANSYHLFCHAPLPGRPVCPSALDHALVHPVIDPGGALAWGRRSVAPQFSVFTVVSGPPPGPPSSRRELSKAPRDRLTPGFGPLKNEQLRGWGAFASGLILSLLMMEHGRNEVKAYSVLDGKSTLGRRGYRIDRASASDQRIQISRLPHRVSCCRRTQAAGA